MQLTSPAQPLSSAIASAGRLIQRPAPVSSGSGANVLRLVSVPTMRIYARRERPIAQVHLGTARIERSRSRIPRDWPKTIACTSMLCQQRPGWRIQDGRHRNGGDGESPVARSENRWNRPPVFPPAATQLPTGARCNTRPMRTIARHPTPDTQHLTPNTRHPTI